MKCPEQGCYGGVLQSGVGPLHEQRQTGCPRCKGTGEVPDAGDRTTRDNEPTRFTNVLVTLVFGFLALIATLLVVMVLGGWLGSMTGFHAFTEAWVPDVWLADRGQAGTWSAAAVAFGLVLAAAFAITVVRRRASRSWLADRQAPRSQLVRTVLSWGLLRSVVLVFGAGVAFGTGVVVDRSPDQRAELLAGPSGGLSGVQWGFVVLAALLWTVFTVGRSLRKYDRFAAAQAPVPDEAPGTVSSERGRPSVPPPTPPRDPANPLPPPPQP